MCFSHEYNFVFLQLNVKIWFLNKASDAKWEWSILVNSCSFTEQLVGHTVTWTISIYLSYAHTLRNTPSERTLVSMWYLFCYFKFAPLLLVILTLTYHLVLCLFPCSPCGSYRRNYANFLIKMDGIPLDWDLMINCSFIYFLYIYTFSRLRYEISHLHYDTKWLLWHQWRGHKLLI